MLTKKNAENAACYACVQCDFRCSKKSNYEKHLLTRKHINAYASLQNNCDQPPKLYMCSNCNKGYAFRQSLYTHKKKCKEVNCTVPNPTEPEEKSDIVELLINENKEFKNVILDLFKSNSELQKQMLELCKNSNTTNNTTNNNSHNKTFNLQFFLNEQCKDAMNIMDFVNTFQLQFSDLERIGEVGYVEGISTIVIDKLNEMDVYKRPIHCSDAKREIMYVKDKDVWAKETANNDKIRLALKHITKKNSDMIRPWANAHPGVLNSEHRLSDKYQEIIIEAMGGNSGTIKECETKIIKKISKMVLIDKNN